MDDNLATMTVENPEITCNITFHNKDNEEVGCLEFSGKKMIFKGKMEESAQVFFEWLLEQLVNPYIEKKLTKEK
ncbi:hypothetical protein E3J84_00105 [Candidatus Aerophobetes bacterium]|uniref:Uncharacterized protein n=1 Tax=Aerophobetes bacterium TaxID=2030807 RepID=A0A523S5R9_UNCAE|nr:MAG: hypothetical protein E3J84_00105 [Candidatus Aerophobetes bacterium]